MLQVHKFNKQISIKWDPQVDPQGQQRLVAHVVLDDLYVAPPGGKTVFIAAKSVYVSLPANQIRQLTRI
jgi:hypothetical protein